MASGQLASFAVKNVHGLDTGEKKGSGAYGVVYKVTVDGVPGIAKRLHDILVDPKVPRTQRASIQQKFHDECVLLSQLRHPNVVHFVGVHYGSNQDDMSLIMECLDTDLARCLETQPNIPIEVKLLILLDVSYGLLYLHTLYPQIIHRDLTAANILLTRDKRAKIADLGVSKLLDPRTQAAMTQTKAPGTHFYMPPEALMKNPKYDVKLDIFSFGHLALYVINQVFPEVFEVRTTPVMLREETLQIEKRQEAIDEMGRDHCLHHIVLQCLQDNPEKRPTTLKLNEMLNRLCMKHPRERGVTELETEIQGLWTENKKLDGTVQEFRKGCEALMNDYQALADRLHETEAERDMYSNQYEMALRELTQKAEENKQQEQQLKEATERNKLMNFQLDAEIQGLQTENKELEGTVQEFRKECEALMNDYQALADRLHETEAERDKYSNQYETALRELARRAERIKQLEQQRKEAMERNKLMNFQELARSRVEGTKLNAEVEQLRREKEEVLGELAAHKLTAQTYQEDFEQERKDREKAHSQVAEIEERYQHQLQSMVTQLTHTSQDLQKHKEKLATTETLLHSQIEQLSDRLSEKDRQLAIIGNENDRLQEEVLSKTQQVKQYKKQVDQYKEEVGAHKHVAEIQMKQKSCAGALIATQQENSQLKRMLDLLRGEVDQLKGEKEQLEGRSLQLDSHLRHLQTSGSRQDTDQKLESSTVLTPPPPVPAPRRTASSRQRPSFDGSTSISPWAITQCSAPSPTPNGPMVHSPALRLRMTPTTQSVPIAVAFQETCHAIFRGTDLSQCIVKVAGEMIVSFPSSYLGQLGSHELLQFQLSGMQKLERLHHNQHLMAREGDRPLYKFNMSALSSHLRQMAEKLSAPFYNVQILKYKVGVADGSQLPLKLLCYWKCEPTVTNFRLDYTFLSSVLSTHSTKHPPPLTNVVISLPVGGEVRNALSKPMGVWSGDQNKMVWTIGNLQPAEQASSSSLQAKFEVSSGPSVPTPAVAQFLCEGATLSGLGLELVGSGYHMSLLKEKCTAGKYMAEINK